MIQHDDQDYDEPYAPDLRYWHRDGAANGATHMIITFEGGYDDFAVYQPVYVFPEGDSLERVQHLCEGGGHIHATFDLSEDLTQEQIDRFYRSVR